MTAAFFLPDGDRYVATEHTRGPWDVHAQHAGPPSALLVHALERGHPRDDARIVRIAIEILRPVPITALEVRTEVVRPGRRVELLAATLSADGEACMLARAWRVRTTDLELPSGAGPLPPLPETAVAASFFNVLADVGWHTSVETRFTQGAWTTPGPASAWFRLRVPVVAGRQPTPFERVLAVADAGNGISASLDFSVHLFVNTDLTVVCHRPPDGEWVHMDAETRLDRAGIGVASSRLSDERGPLGVGAQSLYVARHGD